MSRAIRAREQYVAGKPFCNAQEERVGAKCPNVANFCYYIFYLTSLLALWFRHGLGSGFCHSFVAALQRERTDPGKMRRAVRPRAIVTD
jgi:hypothetical protein